MAKQFTFTGPDGKTYEVEGPDTATEQEAFALLQSQMGQQQQAVPPGVPNPVRSGSAVPEDLQSGPRPYNFWNPPEGLVRTGLGEAGAGIAAMSRPGMDAKAGAASDTLRGLAKAVSPAAIPLAVANPVGAIGAALGGMGGGMLTGAAAGAMGAGPGMQQAAEDIGGALGGGLGFKGARALKAAIPSKVRAGANFQAVMDAARDVPVDTSRISPILDRGMDLSERGYVPPRVMKQLTKTLTDPARPPMTYAEARDFASAASQLSAKETMNTKGDMGRQVKLLAAALREANREAAAKAGVAPQYDAAMAEYAKAKKMDALVEALKKYGKRAAAVGALGGAGAAGYRAVGE